MPIAATSRRRSLTHVGGTKMSTGTARMLSAYGPQISVDPVACTRISQLAMPALTGKSVGITNEIATGLHVTWFAGIVRWSAPFASVTEPAVAVSELKIAPVATSCTGVPRFAGSPPGVSTWTCVAVGQAIRPPFVVAHIARASVAVHVDARRQLVA